MRIALAQINPTLGSFNSNGQKIIEYIERAKQKHAHLVVFPEMAVYGYPANDSLEYSHFVRSQIDQIKNIQKKIPPKITAVFGAVLKNDKAAKQGGKPYLNSAIVMQKNSKPKIISKQLLPTYDVYDESRFFEKGSESGIAVIPNIGRVGVSVCEDMWGNIFDNTARVYSSDPFEKFKNLDLMINISASPFSKTHMSVRLQEAKRHVKRAKCPFVYVNQVGGQDELIFDGSSFILESNGKIAAQATSCEEDLLISDLEKKASEFRPLETDQNEILRQVLVLGLRDFVRKTGNSKIHLGLSGGIDSSLVAALAVDAVGPARVTGFLLPGPYSSKGSIGDAVALAKNLGINSQTISISEPYAELLKAASEFQKIEASKVSIMEQNIQARIRGLILMAFSNAKGSLLLSTTNKSEMAVGYGTLYGDLCGSLAPIGDLTKREVYSLARHYNRSREIIPAACIEKAPSAELAPNQTDQDTLPLYEDLDDAVQNLVEKKMPPKSKVERWVMQKILLSEFKRRQSPPILRVSDHAFGIGRRMPIAFNPTAP